jgi:hypothetical protein
MRSKLTANGRETVTVEAARLQVVKAAQRPGRPTAAVLVHNGLGHDGLIDDALIDDALIGRCPG